MFINNEFFKWDNMGKNRIKTYNITELAYQNKL
jgi:hypothetical protein